MIAAAKSSLLFVVAMGIGAASCQSTARIGGTTPTGEVIDDLRKKNTQLQQEVQQLEQKLAQRIKELEDPQADGAGGQGAGLPRVSRLRFARYSGAIDTDDDGADEVVRLYLQTLDQHDRFILAAGRAVVQVVAIRPEQKPMLLAEGTFEGDVFDQTYRSSLLGTHYRLEVDLPDDLDPSIRSTTVKLTFADTVTGRTLERQLMVRIERP